MYRVIFTFFLCGISLTAFNVSAQSFVVTATANGEDAYCELKNDKYIAVEQNTNGEFKTISPKLKRLRKKVKKASGKLKKKLKSKIKKYSAMTKACKGIVTDVNATPSPTPTLQPSPSPTGSQQVFCYSQAIYQICTSDPDSFFGQPCSQHQVTGGGLGSNVDEAALISYNDCQTNLTTALISGNISGSSSVYSPCQVLTCGSD